MANDNAEVPNAALRDHVSSHQFVLTLQKTHIATLVAIANNDRSLGGNHWITALDGLKRRGLAFHAKDYFGPKKVGDPYSEPARYWAEYNGLNIAAICRLTRAGWAVYDLLVEAGIAPSIERKSSLRKNVA